MWVPWGHTDPHYRWSPNVFSGGVLPCHESICHPSTEFKSFVCITCWLAVILLLPLNIMNRKTSAKELTNSLIGCWHWQKLLSLHKGKQLGYCFYLKDTEVVLFRILFLWTPICQGREVIQDAVFCVLISIM